MSQNPTDSSSLICPSYVNLNLRKLNTLIESTVQFKRRRWAFASLLSASVTYRSLNLEFLAIIYIAFLYLIYLIVQFFTPSGLPDPDGEAEQVNLKLLRRSEGLLSEEQEEYSLKSIENDKPVLRSITEFILWKKVCLVCLISWACTYFEVLKIPVYWPFLLIYFLFLVGLAIKRHYYHMMAYQYSLTDFNHKTKGKTQNDFDIFWEPTDTQPFK